MMIDPSPVRLMIAGAGVAFAMLAETVGPGDVTALGRDLVVAGVLFYFYRQISMDFRKIVQEMTAAITNLRDDLEKRTVQCPFAGRAIAEAEEKKRQ